MKIFKTIGIFLFISFILFGVVGCMSNSENDLQKGNNEVSPPAFPNNDEDITSLSEFSQEVS